MPQVTKLEIFHSLVGVAGCEALAAACLRKRKSSYLQILRLDHNPAIGTAGMNALCDALYYNDQLKILSAANCGIGSDATDAISKLLSSPDTRLKSLNLSGNPLRNAGIVVLAEGLVKNRGSLTTLNIAHTEFGHCGTNDLSGVKMLSAALKLSEHLTSCNASGNMIGTDGCQLLLTCLAGASHVRELEITPIGIDKPVFEMLLNFLTQNQPEPKKKKIKRKPKPELKFSGGRSGSAGGKAGFAAAAGSGSARLASTLAAAAKTTAAGAKTPDSKSAPAAAAATATAAAASGKDVKTPAAPPTPTTTTTTTTTNGPIATPTKPAAAGSAPATSLAVGGSGVAIPGITITPSSN